MTILKNGKLLRCEGNNRLCKYVGLDEETNGHMLRDSKGEVGPIGSNFLMNNYRPVHNYAKKFTILEDPGHGWVKVSKKLILDLGIWDQISTGSFINKGYAYLEEDYDGFLFHESYKKLFGHQPVYRSAISNKSSRIREYDSFPSMRGTLTC